MSRKILILSLLPSLFISASLLAQDAILTFDEMDKDVDGYISLSEALASDDIANNFNQIDTDADGQINIIEFQDYMGIGRVTPPNEMEEPEPGAAPY